MNIDNRLSWERIKGALSSKAVAIVLLIVVIASAILYITLENNDSNEMLIWMITDDNTVGFSQEDLQLINDLCVERGVDKAILSRRHPDDTYFDVTMSTSAYYNCDIFIMKEETAKKYYEMDMFLPFSLDGDLLYIDGNAVGIMIFEDYYLLINKKTDIDKKIIYDMIDLLIEK